MFVSLVSICGYDDHACFLNSYDFTDRFYCDDDEATTLAPLQVTCQNPVMHCHGATATYATRIEPLSAGSAAGRRLQVGKVDRYSGSTLLKHPPNPDGDGSGGGGVSLLALRVTAADGCVRVSHCATAGSCTRAHAQCRARGLLQPLSVLS